VKREEIIGCGISSKNSSVRDKKDCMKKRTIFKAEKKGGFYRQRKGRQ
jgi:hypothetical protein